ncbi:MAG: hypothetical protein ACX939_11930, partial [Hyphococcus sp.]
MSTNPDTLAAADCPAPDRTVSSLTGLLRFTRWSLILAAVVISAGIVFGPEATLTLGADPLDPDAEGRTAYFG